MLNIRTTFPFPSRIIHEHQNIDQFFSRHEEEDRSPGPFAICQPATVMVIFQSYRLEKSFNIWQKIQ
jgi:hypothetical protein